MDELRSKYDIGKREFARGRNLKAAAWAAPFVLTVFPFLLFLALFVLLGSSPPAAATFLFLGIISTAIGLVVGLILSGIFAFRYSKWTKEMRERIAADGIKAEEIDWFRNELKPGEKRALKEMSSLPLLADAYRETLASRLTATRIVRSSRRELQRSELRRSKIKGLRSDRAAAFQEQIKKDAEKLKSINEDAKIMLAEAESRLQMIEAAAMRGSNLADSELALQKLSIRTSELPLALEEARISEEIRDEMSREPLE